jgi:glycosyltransferase involved in cell wall biosynthesis
MREVSEQRKAISIIIPARNEEAQIGRTVRSALAAVARMENQAADSLALGSTQSEIIVVDNQSTDGTRKTLERLIRRHGVQVLQCTPLGAARARNVGAVHARGDILIFVDADTWIPERSLQRILQLTRERGFRAGIFRLTAQRAGLRAWCWWTFWNAVRRLPLARAKALPAFMFCTREAFERYGPFDEAVAIGEEWPILAGLWREHPHRLVYDRSLTARTSGRRMDLRLFGYSRTWVRYGLAILWRGARVDYTDMIREGRQGST